MKKWWRFKKPRPQIISTLKGLKCYIVYERTTAKAIFEIIPSTFRPNTELIAFTLEDKYFLRILQSQLHWTWVKTRCSTLVTAYRYTTSTVFDTFPWPQSPHKETIDAIEKAAINLRDYRKKIMTQNKWSLRKLYQTLDIPGSNPLRELHQSLDEAVCKAYGMNPENDPVSFLLELNLELAEKERKGIKITGPGHPLDMKK